MKFVSTRRRAPPVTIGAAIRHGAAPDGGLYMPAAPVRLDAGELAGFDTLPALAAAMLRPFFADDRLQLQLSRICAEAFAFPAPLVTPDPGRPNLKVLELFHGPTGAFKDFGARFLMACLSRLCDESEPLTVLVATSGDTGGAVGCAAEGRANLRAFILYPCGRVSAFQAHQLCCWGAPVRAREIDDDTRWLAYWTRLPPASSAAPIRGR